MVEEYGHWHASSKQRVKDAAQYPQLPHHPCPKPPTECQRQGMGPVPRLVAAVMGGQPARQLARVSETATTERAASKENTRMQAACMQAGMHAGALNRSCPARRRRGGKQAASRPAQQAQQQLGHLRE